MIINAARRITTRDVAGYSWARISQYQNVEHTASVIMALHELPSKQQNNAKRQAEQIKFCLAQAKEYNDAARSVSLATRPVLLYYSVMSLALAEVLLKQDGNSRLSMLREKHNCHGLQLSLIAEPKTTDPFNVTANQLAAKPQLDRSGYPRGTFEVWRQSAREYPTGGESTIRLDKGAQTGYQLIFTAIDTPPPILKPQGVSLLACLMELPYMSDVLGNIGVTPNTIRATLSSAQNGNREAPRNINLTVHPGDPNRIDEFGMLVKGDASCVNHIKVIDHLSGYTLTWTYDGTTPCLRSFPPSICLTDIDVHFSCSELNLNEFGILYIALHIAGNFARYYPDVWLRHIDQYTTIATAIDELCVHAFDRLPLLILSELSRTYLVPAK